MKTSAYVIEIEQSEKETGKTMHNTRHELAKLITQNERLQQENQQLKKIISDNTILVEDETGSFQELNIRKSELIKNEMSNLKEKLNNSVKYDKLELLSELNNIGKEIYEIPLLKEYGELFRLYEKKYNTQLFANMKGD